MDWLQIIIGALGAAGTVLVVNFLKWLFKKFGITVESIWAMMLTYFVCLLITLAVLFWTKTIPISIEYVMKYALAIAGAATGLYKIIWPMLMKAIANVSSKK